MLKKAQIIFLFLILFFITSVKGLYATVLFSDEFDYQDNSKWKFDIKGGEIVFKDSFLELLSSEEHYPFITNSKAGLFESRSNISLDFVYNYSHIGYMGSGFGVGYTGEDDYPYYQFSLWNDLNTGLVFQYRDLSIGTSNNCVYNYSESSLLKIALPESLNDGNKHTFRILKNDGKFYVYVDSEIIYTSNINQCNPKNIFIGNPLTGGGTNWDVLNIDKVVMDSNEITPQTNKIIILPGLGASWNADAILTGNTGPSYQWTMTPFVKNYNSLINALEINSKEKGKDFYVWNYDWRKPLKNIVADFDNYIEALSLEGNEKLYLVGHSLGGLVARVWTQDNEDKVEKVITLGSPHYGSVKAYEVWNSARIGDSLGVDSIALNVLLQLQKKENESLVKTLRSYAPIVYDLIPTFSFLKKSGIGVTTKVSEYLVSKNSVVSAVVDKLITIDGVGVTTKEWINLGKRTMIDQMLGIWEEGRPMSYVYGVGDGTVLKKSALITDSEIEEFNSNHGVLVDNSINFVLEKLGLGTTVITTNYYPQKQVVFYLGSPAKMTVKCGSEEKTNIDGWVIMENQELKNCLVKLVGTGNGIYHLVIGEGENWDYQEGRIRKDQIINVKLNKRKNCWASLRHDLKDIGAKDAYRFSEKEDLYKTIDAYSYFWENTGRSWHEDEIKRNLKCLLWGGR